MFSARLPRLLDETPVARRVNALRASGRVYHDLTVSNPTRAGIPYPRAIEEILARAATVDYRPDPRGPLPAREAVAAVYRDDHGVDVSPDRLLLTASTSEAYGFLFKLLADPGSEILVPVPGYPLFEHLARLEGLVPVPYPSWFDGRWQVDLELLGDRVSERTRAVIVVNPNNPTGAYLRQDTWEGLVELCARHRLALISDEVFTDYPRGGRPPPDVVRIVASRNDVLCFSLGGLSKSMALPGVKLAWVLANGPRGLLEEALERLAFIADTYLSVATPVQEALPELLEWRRPMQAAVQRRIATNLSLGQRFFGPESAVSLVPAEAGWYQILRVPIVAPEEATTLALLDNASVLVQPGYFYDFPGKGYLVTSLLVPPATWEAGLAALAGEIDAASRRA